MLELWTIDAIWISVAFTLGLMAKKVNLPPLIGYLVGGFLLNYIGIREGGMALHVVADLGIILLLFTIGLKIDIRSILSKEILLTSSLHMILSVLAFSMTIFIISFFGIGGLTNLGWQSSILIGVALSFSSTVFAVKVLEEKGEMTSFHGNISIGILIIQDIIAVVFLSISKGELPNIFVLGIPIYLYLIRFVFIWLLKYIDQSELLTLFGFLAAFVAGAIVFEFVGLKPDLGALIIGMLIGSHSRSKELAKHMMAFKDFFLIAFFLDIGMSGLPDINIIFISLLLCLLIPFKTGLFLIILTKLNLRARTSWHASLSLSTFSEFGLIIGIIGMKMGLIDQQWLVIIALALSFSYLLASPLNIKAHAYFDRYSKTLTKLNTKKDHPDDSPLDLGDAEIIICGMGHVGRAAYHHLTKDFADKVIGLDYNKIVVNSLQESHKNVVWSDATDSLFWRNLNMENIRYILLTMDDHASNLNTAIALNNCKNKKFSVSSPGHSIEEHNDLKKEGVDYVYNYYSRAGSEFAGSFMNFLEQRELDKKKKS